MTTKRRPTVLRLPFLAVPAALATLFLAAPTLAQRGDFYVGANFGIAGVEIRSTGAFDQIIDGDENALSYEIGYRFSRNVGIEAAFHDLSKVDGSILPCAEGVACSEIGITSKFTAISLALVPRYQIVGRVALFAKVGLVSWEGNIEDAADNLELQGLDRGDTILGVGADVKLIAGLTAVAKWESLGGDIEIFSAGIRLTF